MIIVFVDPGGVGELVVMTVYGDYKGRSLVISSPVVSPNYPKLDSLTPEPLNRKPKPLNPKPLNP